MIERLSVMNTTFLFKYAKEVLNELFTRSLKNEF